MVLEEGNNLFDHLNAGKAAALRLSDELRVAASLSNEVVNVQHFRFVALPVESTWGVACTKGRRKISPDGGGSC